ncbi:MAG: bis(5'-nucleosyl)-tetraphosphatase (symmetrical) YqeK [Atribacterota bacterium]
MDYTELKNYFEILKRYLTPDRFAHCLRVAEEARKLSLRYGEDHENAYLAGLVHDYARDRELSMLKGFLPSWVEEEVYSIPGIWHALAGPSLIVEELGISDYRILHAVRWHATSCEHMSRFDKIIFVADFGEEGRNFSEASEVRKKAWEDLEGGYRLALKMKLEYLLSVERPIYPASFRAWNKETVVR